MLISKLADIPEDQIPGPTSRFGTQLSHFLLLLSDDHPDVAMLSNISADELVDRLYKATDAEVAMRSSLRTALHSVAPMARCHECSETQCSRGRDSVALSCDMPLKWPS